MRPLFSLFCGFLIPGFMARLQCSWMDTVRVVGQDTVHTHAHCINEGMLVRTYMLEFAWAGELKPWICSPAFKAPPAPSGSGCVMQPVSWLSFLSSANVCWNLTAALRLLRQEDCYGALLLIFVEGTWSTGLGQTTVSLSGCSCICSWHTTPSRQLMWRTNIVHKCASAGNVLLRCAIIKRLVIIFRPQFTFPPLWLNCW